MVRIPRIDDDRQFPITRPVSPEHPQLTASTRMSRGEAERLFVSHLGLLTHVVRLVARRYDLSRDAAEDLLSEVRVKLIDDDYAVLRRFEGRSSLGTYLLVVVNRHFLDTRTALWGKWRPSREALKRGPVAVTLDRLMTRDGLSFDEACQALRINHGVTLSTPQMRALAAWLPVRQRRRFVTDDELESVRAETPDPEQLLDASTVEERRRHLRQALQRIVANLPADDRLLLKRRFCEGQTVAAVSHQLKLQQKPLYRRLAIVLRRLRAELEALGVTRDQVVAVLADAAGEIGGILADPPLALVPASGPVSMAPSPGGPKARRERQRRN